MHHLRLQGGAKEARLIGKGNMARLSASAEIRRTFRFVNRLFNGNLVTKLASIILIWRPSVAAYAGVLS